MISIPIVYILFVMLVVLQYPFEGIRWSESLFFSSILTIASHTAVIVLAHMLQG